jgi:dihydroorotase (multifunctional complex type)
VAFDLVIRNGTLVTSFDTYIADVGVSSGSIAAIGAELAAGTNEIDARGLHVLPGLIDGHVHFREPGLEHEETWLTGSRAAVMGGVTTVLDMPNTNPPTDTPARARAKLELAASSSFCDFGVFGLLAESVESVADLAESGLVVGLKAFLGPTTGGLRAPDDEDLRRALMIVREAGLRVAFHAEDRAIIERTEAAVRASGRTDPVAHLDARPQSAEVAAIDRAGKLLLETGTAGHILHLSSAAGLAAVERWRALSVDLTCEVTPHHLLLDRDAYAASGGIAKVNPPIRGEADAAALREAIADGRIDVVGSDHAPHLATEKQRNSIWDVPAGFAGVETALPLLLTYGFHAGWLSLERLVHVTSEAPARIWGLWPRKGATRVGADADITLVDLERTGEIRAQDLHGKNSLSPFDGSSTRGAAVMTVVRGRVVMREARLIDENDQAGERVAQRPFAHGDLHGRD